jgi:hypothetical protein
MEEEGDDDKVHLVYKGGGGSDSRETSKELDNPWN